MVDPGAVRSTADLCRLTVCASVSSVELAVSADARVMDLLPGPRAAIAGAVGMTVGAGDLNKGAAGATDLYAQA